MLFNSYTFIFAFLPVTLSIFFLFGKFGFHKSAIGWLIFASLFFYAWWNPAYLGLIIGLMVCNYMVSLFLIKFNGMRLQRNLFLILGITINLSFLVYFKYANFFIDNINSIFKSNVFVGKVLLPLGISFFIFQKIAFLVDTARGEIKERNFFYYALFVIFFPQLIAGPIVHYKEVVPQFKKKEIFVFNPLHFSVGSTIFFIGLFKKVFIADQVAKISNTVFTIASQGHSVTFFEAWGGALAFTFQIYFDFSGYSDMAIGLARMFGIRLPINFHSPYKAVNIIDFWRRWHITLSRFLRDYVYIPLGGNRKGKAHRYLNLLITMFLGGLWHGAGWTFVLWGGLHGMYLVINHAWHALREWMGFKSTRSWAGQWTGRIVTFICVVVGWVLFRSPDLNTCKEMFKGMLGLNGVVMWQNYQPILNKFFGFGDWLQGMGWKYGLMDFLEKKDIFLLFFLLIWVWVLPNTQQFMARYRPALLVYWKNKIDLRSHWWQWRPSWIWALMMFFITVLTVSGSMTQVSEFIYFHF